MMKHRSNPKLDLPLKPARSILEDNYSAPVLREDKMESHLGLSRRSREWQVPGQTLLSFPGQEEVSALATTIFWGTTMLVAAGTCSGSIFVWIVASSKSHGDENTSLMRTSRRQVSTKGSAAICMLNFFGSRLVALDEAGTVNSWDFACSENATIDAVIPIFSLNNIDELVRGQCTTPGNPKRVHHDETMLNSTQVTVAMSQGIVLDLNLTASEQGGSTRRRSRRAHKQSNSAVQYTCSGQQFALDYHDCEVLFLQTMPFDGSRRIVTVDTSGLCAVWPDPQRDSTLDITWHRRKLPVFSARLFPEKEFGKNISCNTYEGTEVFSRHVLRLAETSENHQLAAICALDRFQSTFREFEETGYVFDNERVVAKERSADTTIATKTYVLSIVPAARNCAAFSVLVLARPSSSQEFTEKVAEGDTLKVYTVASIGDGGKCGPSLVKRKDLTVTHHVAVGSGDAGVPFGECVIAILAPHDEDGYLLMRLGEALYVYHSSIEKSGKKGEPSILHTVIVEPSRHRRQELLVAGATESAAMFVCTSADGLVLFDNPLVQPPRRGESDLELVSEGYDVTKRS